jgi:hypothetical protein
MTVAHVEVAASREFISNWLTRAKLAPGSDSGSDQGDSGSEQELSKLAELITSAGNMNTFDGMVSDAVKSAAAPIPVEPFPENKDGTFAKKLEAELATGTIDIRGAVAQKMLRLIDPITKARYSELKTTKEKTEFRKEWAELSLKELKAKFSKTLEWEFEDVEIGEYIPLTLVIEREGGFRFTRDIEAGLRYAEKCLKMGGRYVAWNPMTERADFFHVRKQHKDTFRQKWEKFVELKSSKNDEMLADAAKGTAATKGEAKRIKVEAAEGTPNKKPKIEQTSGQTGGSKALMNKAFKLKVVYVDTSSKAALLIRQVEAGGAWAWAANNNFFLDMKDKMVHLNSETSEEFICGLLTNSQGDATKKYKNDEQSLLQGLTAFLKLEDHIAKLASVVLMLQRMHSCTGSSGNA